MRIIESHTLHIQRAAYWLYIFGFLLTTISYAQKETSLSSKELKNTLKFDFIPVEMPSEKFPELKPTMGMLGVHYQIPFNQWLYGGAGMYAAITGDQGGLFTLGVELGVTKQLYKNLFVDANFHFGGGGGYRYLVNDGAFINPNIGLKYKKKNIAFGVQYSHVNFYSGEIKSNSLSFFIEIPSILRFTDYKNAHKKYTRGSLTDNFWKYPSVKNAQQIRFDYFFPFGGSKKDDDSPLTETLYVLGFEYQKYIQHNMFIFAHTDAIYKGLRSGFMDLFLGAGIEPYQSEYISLFAKLGVGAAGGRIAPEGGLMIYPSAGIDWRISNHISLSGHGGYYRALAGDLEAYTLGFGIKYRSQNGGIQTISTKKNDIFITQGITFSIENQSYFDVAKTDDSLGILSIDLQLLALQFNYDLTKNLYILGEAGFAYKGRSGGYAHGLVGAGVKTNPFWNTKINLFAELAGGAAGGAGVDTGEGIVIRPTIGLHYNRELLH
jgi:hypothetical protein